MSFNRKLWDTYGYVKHEHRMPASWTISCHNWFKTNATIDRGHDSEGRYHKRAEDGIQWANWWSQDLNQLHFVDEVVKRYTPDVCRLLDEPVLYHSDFVVTTPHYKRVRPHIDTPYRFESFADEERLLGVQCLLALDLFSKDTGGTGFVPGSHRQTWDIKECYSGEHDEYFVENMTVPQIMPGELLMWNPRILHSASPNHTPAIRTALLILFVERDIIDELRVIDNIFTD